MQSGKDHIDFDRLQDYFNGKLSETEMHLLEMEAQNDPFLFDAMDGFSDYPKGLKRLVDLKKNQRTSGKSFFRSRTISIIGIACIMYLIAWTIKPSIDEKKYDSDPTENLIQKEVEVLPKSIEMLVFAEKEEQITANEIMVNKQLIEENSSTNPGFDDNKIVETIHVEDEDYMDTDHAIEREEFDQRLVRYAPSAYLFDLYVVDYSRVERKNRDVSYRRYDLSGLSAEFENEFDRDDRHLIERQVDVPYMDYLKTSMYYFSSGQFKKTLNRCLTIIEQFPGDLNAHFYGGLCYYDLKKYDRALYFFDQALTLEIRQNFIAFSQEAKWYKAETLVKIGDNEKAKMVLDQIIIEGLFYSEEAIKMKANL